MRRILNAVLTSTLVLAGMTSIAFGQESRTADAVKKSDGEADAPAVILRGHVTEVTALAFSADGSQVVSASTRDVRIWDPANGKEIRRLNVDGESVVAFNPDLTRLVIERSFHSDVSPALRGKVTLRDTSTGKEACPILHERP